MRSALAALLRTLAAVLDPAHPDPGPPATIPPLNRSWSDDDAARDERRKLALVALAEDTVAIFGAAVADEGECYAIRLLGDIPQECWPAMAEALARVAKEVSYVRA